MKAEYLAYPPQLAVDVEIIERREGERMNFIVGSAAAGRFILVGEIECNVLRMLSGEVVPSAVCDEFKRVHQAKLTLATLTRFLRRLDETGLLAGERSSRESSSNLMLGPQFYFRWNLFNPDRLFAKMVSRLGWIWTKGFVIATLLLMGLTVMLAMTHLVEVTAYALDTMREHYFAIFVAATLVSISHEFAHGLTCKAFGGRVPEVGLLLVYYVLPGLYCNVSGAYLIPERRRRLLVILAGIYWQMLVGAISLLSWFMVQPHTFISDLTFIVFLASVLDLAFNANPLIKLDGYYFLSQWLQLPNLMDRSREFWRGTFKRILFGERDDTARSWSNREQTIYAAFGLMSFVYTIGLRTVIVFYVGAYLADQFNVAGLMVAGGLGAFYMRRPVGQIASAILDSTHHIFRTLLMEGMMGKGEKKNADDLGSAGNEPKTNIWRRRIVWSGLAVVVAAFLCMPWNASVGNYGTLVAIPDHELIVRAPEDATLIELKAQPGDQIGSGSLIGRMGNLELEEQVVQAQSELTRASAEYERLQGELRTRAEVVARATLQLDRRRHEFNDLDGEEEQIRRPLTARASPAIRFVNVSSASESASSYPAALAMLQADVDRLKVELQEASSQVNRSQELLTHGVVSRSEFELTQTRAASLSLDLVRARQRLEAALIEHSRKYTGSSNELEQARSDLRGENLQIDLLATQLRSARALVNVLGSRVDVLRRKQAQFELVTPRAGTIYGEELPRMVRRYFRKGEEICRVTDTQQLLVRIQLPEREIGDVRVGNHVRLRVRAYPDRIFQGVVSKIGSESERDEQNQITYRVELSVENTDALLRPGMTAFARIDFGRQMIGQILKHKLTQLLRPEAWML